VSAEASVLYRCANAEARAQPPGMSWKLNRSKPALLAEAPKLLSQDCRFLAELRHLDQTRGGAGAGVSASCVGVGGAVSDQTHEAPAQALELESMLFELDLGGAALLENSAREGETLDP